MTYPIFAPTVAPQTVSDSISLQKEENNFGDGYSQTVILGLNAVRSELSLSWPVLTEAQRASIVGFFRDNVGKTFLWAVPGESQRKWKCEKWELDRDRAGISLSATFKEAFI